MGQEAVFHGPIKLPNGTLMAAVEVKVRETSNTQDVHLTVNELVWPNNVSAIVYGFSTSGVLGDEVLEGNLTFVEQIDNSDTHDVVTVRWIAPTTPSAIRLYGGRVIYEVVLSLP